MVYITFLVRKHAARKLGSGSSLTPIEIAANFVMRVINSRDIPGDSIIECSADL
jgi:hypothetical protein